jgi:hypothetical protein
MPFLITLQERVYARGKDVLGNRVIEHERCRRLVRAMFPSWNDDLIGQCVYDARLRHSRCVDYGSVLHDDKHGIGGYAHKAWREAALPILRMGEKVLVTGGVDSIRRVES